MTESTMQQYVHDTWRPMQSGGTWCFEAPILRGPGGLAAGLRRLMEVFGPDWRINRVDIESGDAPDAPRRLTGESLALGDIVGLVEGFPGQVSVLAMKVDADAYVRETPGGAPVRLWLHEDMEITLWPREAPLAAEVCLEMSHSLFRPESPDGDDNRELYDLNRPILAGLLAGLEARFGPLSDYEHDAGPGGYPGLEGEQ